MKIVNIQKNYELLPTWDIEVPDYHYYLLSNGAVSHNTLSMTFSGDVLSSGIEPTIGWAYWRRTRAISKGDWDYYFVIPTAVRNIVLNKIKDEIISLNPIIDASKIYEISDDYHLIDNFSGSIIDNDGTAGAELIRIITKYIDFKLLQTAYDIDPFKKIEMMGKVQKWVDAAISVTFNVHNGFSKDDTERLFLRAYGNQLKSMTIFRDGARDGILFFEFPKIKKVKKVQDIIGNGRPLEINYVLAPKRPKKLLCDIHKVLKHNVIIGLFDDKPYEIFIIDYDKKLPENGIVEKMGSRKYMLSDSTGKVIIQNIIDSEVSNDEIRAFTRITSASLRHGVPIDFISEQLGKCGDSISAYPKMIGRALKKYKFLLLDDRKHGLKICPSCNEQMYPEGGCYTCLQCGYGKCM